MVGHRQSRRKQRSLVSLIMGQVWYLFVFDLVTFLASLPLIVSSAGDAASDASDDRSSTPDCRRSPKQTMHVSAMPWRSVKGYLKSVVIVKH